MEEFRVCGPSTKQCLLFSMGRLPSCVYAALRLPQKTKRLPLVWAITTQKVAILETGTYFVAAFDTDSR